jgi:hypothetical protein
MMALMRRAAVFASAARYKPLGLEVLEAAMRRESQASQQAAIKHTAPHARWRRMANATARLFMVLGCLAREQGMICCASSNWPRLPTLAGAGRQQLASDKYVQQFNQDDGHG